MSDMRPHYVYRHYSHDGDLLYVGVTVNPRRRPFVRHERPWLDSTVRVVVSPAMTRVDALATERAVIAHDNPRHNIYRNNGNLTALERAANEWLDSRTPEQIAESDRRMAAAMSEILAPAMVYLDRAAS